MSHSSPNALQVALLYDSADPIDIKALQAAQAKVAAREMPTTQQVK